MMTLKIAGCRIELHFSCFALLAFCCLFAGASGSVFLFLAVFLHEMAHLLSMLIFRSPPVLVRVSALGCRIVLDSRRPLSYLQNAAVSIAGPAANLLAFAAMAAFGAGGHEFSVACLALGAFHLLPIEPLDGALVLRALLCCFREEAVAGRCVFLISLIVLFPLAVAGFLVLLHTRYNFSLLALSLYLMFYILFKRDFFPV